MSLEFKSYIIRPRTATFTQAVTGDALPDRGGENCGCLHGSGTEHALQHA